MIYDMHCDTIYKLRQDRRSGGTSALRENGFHLDLMKMKQAGYGLQCFACFVDKGEEADAAEQAEEELAIFYSEAEKNQDLLGVARSWQDIEENEKAGRMSAILTIEGGEACHGDLERLKAFYDKGIRLMTLTWNYENELGFPNLNKESTNELDIFHGDSVHGLKEKGIEFLEEMERLGILIDVSHLSDAGFYDVAAHTKKSFVASHSNARTVAGCVRNLTDDMIRIVAERGGVIGLNYCADFLRDPEPGAENVSRVEDMVKHVWHIRRIGGTEVLGLGSDFDGIGGEMEISDCSRMGLLIDVLKKSGMTEREIDGICYRNVRRVLKERL